MKNNVERILGKNKGRPMKKQREVRSEFHFVTPAGHCVLHGRIEQRLAFIERNWILDRSGSGGGRSQANHPLVPVFAASSDEMKPVQGQDLPVGMPANVGKKSCIKRSARTAKKIVKFPSSLPESARFIAGSVFKA